MMMLQIVRFLLVTAVLGLAPVSASDPARSAPKSRSEVMPQALIGVYVAQALDTAFNDGSSSCPGGKPLQECSGFLLSAFENGHSPGYWFHPTPEGRLSFTYMRKDVTDTTFGPAGFILWQKAQIDTVLKAFSPNVFSPPFHCAFPIDGMTMNRHDNGCGAYLNNSSSAPCQTLGIFDATTWLFTYLHPSPSNICGFALDGDDKANASAMQAIVGIIAGSNIRGSGALARWNEVVLRAWPSDHPERVPLMAIFHMPDWTPVLAPAATKRQPLATDAKDALKLAKQQQLLYYNTTKIFAPVIRIAGTSPNYSFSFQAEDQAPDIPENVNVFPD